MAVRGDCEPRGTDGSTVVVWYCELAMTLGTVARFWFFGLVMAFVGDWEPRGTDGLTVVVWYCELATRLGTVDRFWFCGLIMMAVGDCEPTMSADGFSVVGWYCELTMGLVASVASILGIDGSAQSEARLCLSSVADLLVRFKHII